MALPLQSLESYLTFFCHVRIRTVTIHDARLQNAPENELQIFWVLCPFLQYFNISKMHSRWGKPRDSSTLLFRLPVPLSMPTHYFHFTVSWKQNKYEIAKWPILYMRTAQKE